MLPVDLALCVLGFLFALGSGVSIGWVLCEKHRKANPEGAAKIAAAAADQIELIRHQAKEEIERASKLFDETKAALLDQGYAWQAHAKQLAAFAALHPPGPPPTPPPPARSLDLDQSVARATGNGVTDETKARDALLSHGVSPEKADAILEGKLDNIPADELLSQLTDEIIRDSTKAV